MQQMKNKKERAITLISLVVTIIVLIILAGVTLHMVIGENGLIDDANFSSFATEYSSVKEQVELNTINQKIENDEIEKAEVKYPIDKNQKVELSSIEKTLIETIKETENIQSATNENVELYKIDLNKINMNIKREYVINVKSGELYALKGIKYKNKIYHRNNNNVDINKEESIEQEYENKKIFDIDVSTISKIENNCTKVNDLSGNDNNAIFKNVILNETKDSINFLGNTSSFGELEKESLKINFPCTISFAINPNNTKNDEFVFSDPVTKATFVVENSTSYIYCSGTDSNVYKMPSNMFDGNIKYITIVYNSGVTDHQLYINGEKIEKLNKIDFWNIKGTKMLFGLRNYNGYNRAYSGNLYNFVVYNSAFTEEQVENNYIQDKAYIENNVQKTLNESDKFIEYDFRNISSLQITEKIKSINDKSNLKNIVNFTNTIYNKSEKAMEFNGNDSLGKVQLKEPIKYPCTITYVIKPKSNRAILFSDYNSNIVFGLYDGYIYCSHPTNNLYKVPDNFYNGNKKYVTVVYGENEMDNQLYINGKKIEKSDKEDFFNVYNTKDTYIGNRNYEISSNYPYSGFIYSIKIYKEKFKEEVVQKVYDEDLIKYGE